MARLTPGAPGSGCVPVGYTLGGVPSPGSPACVSALRPVGGSWRGGGFFSALFAAFAACAAAAVEGAPAARAAALAALAAFFAAAFFCRFCVTAAFSQGSPPSEGECAEPEPGGVAADPFLGWTLPFCCCCDV